MSSSLRQIAARPQLVILSIMIFVQGCAYGATLPYLAVTAIGDLGMSDQAYSALTIAASVMTVGLSVSLGILSDGVADRRRMIVLLSLVGTVGYGSVFVFANIPVFVLATALVIPFAQSVHSLLFAAARVETKALQGRDAAAVNTVIRSFMSASWVVMPAILGLLLSGAGTMIGAWGAAALCTLSIAMATTFLLKPATGEAPAGIGAAGFKDALKELGTPQMLVRMIAMACITGITRLAGIIWPLILTLELGGSTRDVGFIAALIAFIEIPFMLIAASLLRRFSLLSIIVVSAIAYGAHMAGFAFASAPWHIYALAFPGAAAAAALLSMPLTYFQDLFPTRPGLGTAFMPINSFLGNAVSALTFAMGSHLLGYSGTAWLGLVLAISGVVALLLVERRVADVGLKR